MSHVNDSHHELVQKLRMGEGDLSLKDLQVVLLIIDELLDVFFDRRRIGGLLERPVYFQDLDTHSN